MLDHVDRCLQIDDFLGICSGALEDAGAPYPVKDIEDTEGAAAVLRSAWNLDSGQVADMTGLAEVRGSKVLRLALPGSVSGAQAMARRWRSPNRRAAGQPAGAPANHAPPRVCYRQFADFAPLLSSVTHSS